MLNEIWISYTTRIPLFIGPTILWILLGYFHLYKDCDSKQVLKGIALSFFTSFTVLYFFCLLIYCPFLHLLPQGALENDFAMSMLAVSIYTVVAIALMFIFTRHIPYVCRQTVFVQRNFCGYLYLQMMICLYMALIIANNALEMNLLYLVFTLAWYIVFYKDLDFLRFAYPVKFINPSNICLVFNYVIIALLWASPTSLITAFDGEFPEIVTRWLTIYSVLIYAFSIVIHKVIVNALRHQLREEFFMNSDELTGLSNRRFFMNKATEAIEYARKSGTKVACIYLDIIDFKYFNDNRGREAGDEVLRFIARQLQILFHLTDGFARLGDDHFVVLTLDTDNVEEKIAKLNEALVQDEVCRSIHLRYGIYLGDCREGDAEEIADKARRASRYSDAKKNKHITYYNYEMDKKEKLEHYVVENIDRAIEEKLLQVFYQPIMDAESGELACAETLVRWFDDIQGFIGPDVFIPTLEDYNLAHKVDEYVIETVCQGIQESKRRGKPVFPASVNISRKDFFARDMVAFVDECAMKYGVERDELKIEITESAFVEDKGYIQKQVDRFRELGYKVWMDDFGSGMSSLNNIANYAFDGIKMDMLFLRNMSDKSRYIMEGIVKVAKELGITVLFEGVETQEQYEFIQKIGCQLAQGYLFSKPKPMSTFMNQKEE